jgi:t-SNARE complex subunit (syntaxin)
MSELQNLALKHLEALRRESATHQNAQTRQQSEHAQIIKTIQQQTEAIKTLETRQDEFEKLLQDLSELYNHLLPLIETINSYVRNGSR